MLPLGNAIVAGLDNPVIYALNGPVASRRVPGKFQHFEIESLYTPAQFGKHREEWDLVLGRDGTMRDEACQMERIAANIDTAGIAYNAVFEHLLVAEGLPLESAFIAGYSQGGLMALHMAPRLAQPVAAVGCMAAALVAADQLESDTISRPPILLTHGSADKILPLSALKLSAHYLTNAGFETTVAISPGGDHNNDWLHGAQDVALFFAHRAGKAIRDDLTTRPESLDMLRTCASRPYSQTPLMESVVI